MATYAVGDVQGCLRPLLSLLERIKFNPARDKLWFAGDLVNRGPDSLFTLRFVKSLGDAAIVVLGNHDLHLLAFANGHKTLSPRDTLAPILRAPDCDELVSWLQTRPLLHYDEEFDTALVHAGIPPIWNIKTALKRAEEVHAVLRNEERALKFFKKMYGNSPDTWNGQLAGSERLRLITNYFTRMRFCSSEGKLELTSTAGPNSPPNGYSPWFSFKKHKCRKNRVIFGHWASLMGKTGRNNFIGLDTGCVWGGKLSLYCLNDHTYFRQDCKCKNPQQLSVAYQKVKSAL